MKGKQLTALFVAFVFLVACGSGCATQEVLRETKLHSKYNPETKTYDEVPGNKRVFAVVPFAVLLDIATAPILVPYALCVSASAGH